jgi:predicted adenine nucleotide alpha hydrolase (AANH) superfamily ATPase
MLRLQKTAFTAKTNNFSCFASAMSISPHKNFQLINNIGKNLEQSYGVTYLESDFKKKDGFKKTNELSTRLGLYRQDYCGCIYSLKK